MSAYEVIIVVLTTIGLTLSFVKLMIYIAETFSKRK